MIVEIESEIFDNQNDYDKLNHLFVFFATGKHDLFLSDDISQSSWVDNNSKKTFCENIFKNSVYVNRNTINLKIESENDADNNIFSLDDGYIYLQNDVIIFVENATSDRHFLQSVFKNFTPESSKILNAFNKRWIRYNGAGGKTEIVKEINNELRRFRHENLPNESYLRAIIIIDSDKKHSTQELSVLNQNILQYCIEKNLRCHILEKREVENYLPVEAFADIPAEFNIVAAYTSLNNQQQSFYDLEKGFNGDLKNLDQEIQDLFDGIPNENMTSLRNGFRSITDFKPKQHITPLFMHKNVSRHTLTSKCDSNELLDIINVINNLL